MSEDYLFINVKIIINYINITVRNERLVIRLQNVGINISSCLRIFHVKKTSSNKRNTLKPYFCKPYALTNIFICRIRTPYSLCLNFQNWVKSVLINSYLKEINRIICTQIWISMKSS